VKKILNVHKTTNLKTQQSEISPELKILTTKQ
jgi:hypothetical protein